jgi:hypothetical protein
MKTKSNMTVKDKEKKVKVTRITYELREDVMNIKLFFTDKCCSKDYLNFLNSKGIYPKEDITNYDGYFTEVRRKLKNGSYTYDYYIWTYDKKDVVNLSHELIHLTTRVMKDCGLPIKYEFDEFIAYYHSYWLRRIINL